MFNWLWKRLGYHICEEFTQWERHKVNFDETPVVGGIPMTSMTQTVTRRWQERRCTICGKTYQEDLRR